MPFDVSDAQVTQDNQVYASGYIRRDFDLYPTLDRMPVHVLMHVLKKLNIEIDKTFWEPCYGYGDLAMSFASYGRQCFATDIHDHRAGCLDQQKDVLKITQTPNGLRDIITNPPYDKQLADVIIKHLLDLAEARNGRCILLLRHEFDAASGPARRQHFKRSGFLSKILLPSRPRFEICLPAPFNKSPRFPFAWYVWDFSQQQSQPMLFGDMPDEYPGCKSMCGGHKFDGVLQLLREAETATSKLSNNAKATLQRLNAGNAIMPEKGRFVFCDGKNADAALIKLLMDKKPHPLGKLIGYDKGLPLVDQSQNYQSWTLKRWAWLP